MARPQKCRRVCSLPQNTRYGPLGSRKEKDPVILSIDEYETIRLIDLEGFTQEECAGKMNVARTTVQGIYGEARRKMADSLVNGKTLLIRGGNIQLCRGGPRGCGRGCSNRQPDPEETVE